MTAYTKNLFLTSLLISTISLGYSAEKKQLYILGGGGEPKGDTTIFDNDLKTMGAFASSGQWDTTVSFNGGHAKTEEIVKTKFGNSRDAGAFVEKNYNAMVDEMIKKIERGELVDGDQLMVMIDTHGARNYKEKSHQIALSHGTATNLQTLEGASTVNLDSLEKLIKIAGEKNVKLAVIDMSCFSGNTLKLKNDKVCMISATGPDQYGYAGTYDLGLFSVTNTFSGKFYDLMKKGKNLEEIFMAARTKGSAPDFPMITTPEADSIEAMMYKMMKPYLRYNKQDTSDYDNSYATNFQKFEKQVCTLNQNHQQFLDLLSQMEKNVKVSSKASLNEFATLRKALEDYRRFQMGYENSIRGSMEAGEEIEKILERDYPQDKKIWSRYEPASFLSVSVDASLKRMQELYDKEKEGWTKNYWKENIDQLTRHKQMIGEIKEKLSQSSKDKIAAYNKAFSESGKSYGLASKVSVEAKKVYETLYKSMKDKNKSNPCRDFVL